MQAEGKKLHFRVLDVMAGLAPFHTGLAVGGRTSIVLAPDGHFLLDRSEDWGSSSPELGKSFLEIGGSPPYPV
jgi:hypothetical protein